MPPISPMKDGATGKTVKSATLTPLRTLELNEVYQLITANKRPQTTDTTLRHSLRRIHPTTERLPKATLRTGGGGRRPSRLA